MAAAVDRKQETGKIRVEARVEKRPAAKKPKLISIIDLEMGMCKWPEGTPGEEGFTFCGTRTAPGGSYCTPHARQAYHVLCTKKHKRRDFAKNNPLLRKESLVEAEAEEEALCE